MDKAAKIYIAGHGGFVGPPLIKIGVGEDLTIREFADVVKYVVGFAGGILFDSTKLGGTPRKLMNINRLQGIAWRAAITLQDGVARAYADLGTCKL